MAGGNNLKQVLSAGHQPGTLKRGHGDAGDDIDMSDITGLTSAPKRAKEDFQIVGCSQELITILNEQLSALDLKVAETISSYASKSSGSKAWASEWKTERLWLALPVSGMSVDNSLIDQVVLCGIKNARSRVTLTQGLGADKFPELSAEDEKFMGGILAAMTGDIPSTLKTSSSKIIDLTFYAVWNLCAARLVSNVTKRGSIHPSVLPDKPVRGSSASEYLTSRFRALKATLGLEYAYVADTIERVLKLWSEENAERTRDLLLHTKISWNLVLSKGAEYKMKTVGKSRSLVRQLTTPLNPKDAAWVMPHERKILSHLCAPIWGRIDGIGKEWASLTAEASHLSFDSFVSKLKLAYKEMHRVSESVVRRLGLRKSAVLNSPNVKGLSKRILKEKKANDLVLIFSKSDLTALPDAAKAIFEPFFTGEAFADEEEIRRVLKGQGIVSALRAPNNDLKSLCSCKANQMLIDWEVAWVSTFAPSLRYSPRDRPTTAVETQNMFQTLSGDDEDME